MIQLLTATAIALSTWGVSADPVEWQSDYGRALESSRAAARPLLIVLDDPSTPETNAVEHLNGLSDEPELLTAFERCHVDINTEYGKRVAEVFKATEFPFAAIIDKTGSVVLCKRTGQLSDEEWQDTLTTYRSGERRSLQLQTTFFRGGTGLNSAVTSPSYCPECQLKAMQQQQGM